MCVVLVNVLFIVQVRFVVCVLGFFTQKAKNHFVYSKDLGLGFLLSEASQHRNTSEVLSYNSKTV